MNPAPGSVFYGPQLAAMPQLREKPCQGFETKKTAWKPGPNVCNSTAAIGMRAGLVLEGVRKTYRARYYNPTTGRFLSEDPMGFWGSGTNFYAYAGNNPISYRDPTGLANQNWLNPAENRTIYDQANAWNPSGEYSIVAHGMVNLTGPNAGQSADLLANLDGSAITPEQLAQYVLNDPNWKHQPIELRACSAGQHGWNSFAQKLANILGVDVTAPTDILIWASNGNTSVRNGGSMQTFNHVRR
jgi:uncharacterized protein RhaS with RHS repeats